MFDIKAPKLSPILPDSLPKQEYQAVTLSLLLSGYRLLAYGHTIFGDVVMLYQNPKVVCYVNTCTHWVPGNSCGAANIDILYEEEGKMSNIAEQTECKTFAKRSSPANIAGSLDNVNWFGVATEMALPGKQLSPSVTCVVSSCQYWGKENICKAPEIEVTGQGANECQDTDCSTFRNRGQP